MPRVRLPLGFKFQPTDEDLISGYLLPKCQEKNLPFEIITSDDVYEKPPSDFCTDSTAFFGDDNIAKHYFFTYLNRAKERADRMVGSCGYWHESSKKKIKNNNNETIGYKKLLNFIRKGEGKKATEWLMHEFSLRLNEGESKNLVLCVIQNKKAEKGTGSCLVLGLDLGSGSGRLEIAQVKSCSDLFDEETAEANRGTGGVDHIVPQLDEEMAEAEAEAERGTGELDHHDLSVLPLDDEAIASWVEELTDPNPQFGPSFL